MKQTAVEWLVEQFSDILGKIKTEPMQDLLLIDAFNKAKVMEKEQRRYSEEDLREAYMVGKHGGTTQTYYDFEDWFEQFKKKQS